MTIESLVKTISHKDVNSDYVRNELKAIACDFHHLDTANLSESAKEHGYSLSINGSTGINLVNQEGLGIFTIAIYEVLGSHIGFAEPKLFHLESSPHAFEVTSELLNTMPGRRMWLSLRSLYPESVSCCTRVLPFIAKAALENHYGVKDEEILKEAARKLLPFGTEYFGNKEFGMPEETDYSFNWATPNGVLLCTGEMDAIMETTWQMVEESGSLEQLRNYDMRRFADILKGKVGNIGHATDLATYGRDVFNCGLTNYKPVICFSVSDYTEGIEKPAVMML